MIVQGITLHIPLKCFSQQFNVFMPIELKIDGMNKKLKLSYIWYMYAMLSTYVSSCMHNNLKQKKVTRSYKRRFDKIN